MRVFRVLVSYPPLRKGVERSRAAFIGEIKVGEHTDLDAISDAYHDMIALLKKINGGKDVVKSESPPRFEQITLTNGVIIYLDPDPVESMDLWLARASEFIPN